MMFRILAAFAVFLQTVSATSLGIVSTEGGLVEGVNILLENNRYVDVFKGIPFVDFPGRFEKAKPHPGWDGVLKATKFKSRCLQLDLTMTGTMGSEDCLYLNIWVPHGSSALSALHGLEIWKTVRVVDFKYQK